MGLNFYLLELDTIYRRFDELQKILLIIKNYENSWIFNAESRFSSFIDGHICQKQSSNQTRLHLLTDSWWKEQLIAISMR